MGEARFCSSSWSSSSSSCSIDEKCLYDSSPLALRLAAFFALFGGPTLAELLTVLIVSLVPPSLLPVFLGSFRFTGLDSVLVAVVFPATTIVESSPSILSTSLFYSFTYFFIRVPNFSTAFVIFRVSSSSIFLISSLTLLSCTPPLVPGLFAARFGGVRLSSSLGVLPDLAIDRSICAILLSSPAAFFKESSTSRLHNYSLHSAFSRISSTQRLCSLRSPCSRSLSYSDSYYTSVTFISTASAHFDSSRLAPPGTATPLAPVLLRPEYLSSFNSCLL